MIEELAELRILREFEQEVSKALAERSEDTATARPH